ncbi:hypothetical protein GCM10029992_37780 [Glycomyces albus]
MDRRREPFPYRSVTAAIVVGCALIISSLAAAIGFTAGLIALREITGSPTVAAVALAFLAIAAILLFTSVRGFILATVALCPTVAQAMSEYTNWRLHRTSPANPDKEHRPQ